jgi:predicted nuclease of restriction endonuclease-like (RecB) superfamily
MAKIIKDGEYIRLIKDIKAQIQNSQIKAALSVNTELILLYWDMAEKIAAAQKTAVWGDGFLQQMSSALHAEFPDMKGFSYTNLRYMKQWYLFWTNPPIWQQVVAKLDSPANCQQPVGIFDTSLICQQVAGKLESSTKGQQVVAQLAQIPWGHNLVILSKTTNPQEALFYVQKTIKNNWSRAVLTHQIEGQLYRREGKAITNFEAKLPKPQSDLARQIMKDPYNFDFLTMREKYDERELEDALTSSITKFLLELGQGFAYIGRQVPVTVGKQDFFIDLLFYSK